MLYILLILIAVGVLLLSEPGQKLLSFLMGSAFIIVLILVVLVLVLFLWWFTTNNSLEIIKIATIILVGTAGSIVYAYIDKHATKSQKKWIPWLLVFALPIILIVLIPILYLYSLISF